MIGNTLPIRLGGILLLVGTVVGAMVALTCVICGVDPFRLTREETRARALELRPYVAILALIYLGNRATHTAYLAEGLGLNITDALYAVEGEFVLALQSAVPYRYAPFFSFVYVFGFSFVLAFPVVAYFALPSQRYVKELFVAYTVNYGVGAGCYLLFVAYGPRRVVDGVREPLFELYPEVLALTASINSSANVFPSLHVSLAVTATLLAWRTRSEYPRWPWIATPVTGAIVVATMYLGIHWLLDALFGIALAAISVLVALRFVDRDVGVLEPETDTAR